MKKEYILIFLGLLIFLIGSCNSNIEPQKSDPNSNKIIDNPTSNSQSDGDDIANDYFVGKEPCTPSREFCDGLDNDCDEKVDETIGICPFGQLCNSGRCVECPLGKPLEEICDGKDNDCDGQIDEELRDSCGRCISTNNPYPLNREFCDGKDNDCDGQIDEEDGNECNTFVCRTGSRYDHCDKDVKYKCLNKECVSTKICNDEANCYWDWVGEEGKQGVNGIKDVRLWTGPKYNNQVKYYCGNFADTNSQRLFSSCEGTGCIAQLCKGGDDCPTACYATLDGSLLHLRECVKYSGISKICG